MSTELSVIVPVYNEESVLKEFHARLGKVLAGMGVSSEIVFVNDGSRDGSEAILEALKREDGRVRVLSFTRNFGHQIAVKCGLDHVRGQNAVIIDADLQDPPEMIPELWAKRKEGYEVVYAVRAQRDGETAFKKWTAAVFYRLIHSISSVDIPRNTGDFRLITRPVIDAVKDIREKSPYLRGLIAWTGFRAVGVPMHRQPRHAGRTKYSLKKMLHLAWSGISHFSTFPLELATYFGGASIAVSLYFFGHVVVQSPGDRNYGNELVLFAVFFLGGVQLVSIGILGAYLGRSYDEVRPRPLYLLKKGEG